MLHGTNTTKPRRSTRYQPQVRSVGTSRQSWSHQWGDPLEAGSTEGNLHTATLFQDEERSVEELERIPTETVLYSAFCRTRDGGHSTKTRPGKEKTTEIFNVGDTVLIDSNNKTPNVGVIVLLYDTQIAQVDTNNGESMKVKVHWFLRPEQTAKVSAKRQHLPNEIYFSLKETATLIPADIIGHCAVSSQRPKLVGQADKSMKSPAKNHVFRHDDEVSESGGSDTHSDLFFCGLALDGARGLFYEFHWENHRKIAMQDGSPSEKSWHVDVQGLSRWKGIAQGAEAGKAFAENSDNGTDDSFYEDNEQQTSDIHESVAGGEETSDRESFLEGDDLVSSTSKKRRGAQKGRSSPDLTTYKRRKMAVPTPHSKAALRARQRTKDRGKGNMSGKRHNFTTHLPRAATDYAKLQNLPPDPFLRAMHVLHVGARPEVLPCREDEYVEVMGGILDLVEEGSGGCVYISGVPGSGKTATVHAVVRELMAMAERNETNPFTYVEINGLKIPEPSAAYALLWEAVSGHDVATEGHLKINSKEALKRLNNYFSGGVRTGPGVHACVVLMDELDQLLTSKQDVIYNFFNWPSLAASKLIVIAVANTHDLPERVMSAKVRSRLGMVRINFNPYNSSQLQKIVQARLESARDGLDTDTGVEVIQPDAVKFVAMKVSGVNGDARRILDICRRAVELVRLSHAQVVQITHVRQVIDAMQNSPTAAYLRDCSLHERIMLASLLKCVKREGVDEIRWGDVARQHHIYMNSLIGEDDPKRKPTDIELALVLDSLVACRALIIEEGVAASRKNQGDRKVVLNIETGEVERVLSELGGTNWKNALGV